MGRYYSSEMSKGTESKMKKQGKKNTRLLTTYFTTNIQSSAHNTSVNVDLSSEPINLIPQSTNII